MNLQMLKKAIIASIKTTLKLVWSSVAYPLSIKGGKNGFVEDYRIYGNCVQDGTPTSSNPVVIQSVGEYNEATGKYDIPVKVNDTVVTISLDEPLRKVGDYADTIDFASGTVRRIIKREFITTVETRSSNSGTNKIFLTAITGVPLLGVNKNGLCISDKFANGGEYSYSRLPSYTNVIQSYVTSSGGYRVAYTFEGNISLEEAQSLIGDGFEVCYVLKNAVVEKIELPKLPQFKGTTIYETNTQIAPSGIEVQYYE